MANNRETKRERREVAKQRRMEELRRRQRKERMRKFWYAGLSVLVIGGIVAAVLLSKSQSGKKVEALNTAVTAAGCSALQSPADEGNSHIAAPTRVSYKTNPPTSGNHSGSPSPTGILPNPLPPQLTEENLVHNMEHGAMEIWYKPTLDGSLVDSFKSFVRDNPTRRIFVVHPEMDYQVAFTAWGQLVGCANPNSKVLDVARTFAGLYQGTGPEGDIPGVPTGV